MILESLFLILLVVGLCVLAYRGANHEFQILQKDYTRDTNWSEVLSEQLPLVIRDLPKHWLGSWTKQRTEQKAWVVTITDDEDRQYRTTWNVWQATPNAPQPDNMKDIGQHAKLNNALLNWNTEDFRCWSWLPASVSSPIPAVFSETTPARLQKTTAESTVIVSTDGVPLEVWIAHEGAVPSATAELLLENDPWLTTTDTIPDINEVKYIEITLRPTQAVVLPKHWFYAIRAATTGQAWFWTAQFHTPISYIIGAVQSTKS